MSESEPDTEVREESYAGGLVRIRAESSEGFLCRLHMDALLRLSPAEALDVFSNPDSTHLFQDVKQISHRWGAFSLHASDLTVGWNDDPLTLTLTP